MADPRSWRRAGRRLTGDLFGGAVVGLYTLPFSFAYGALVFSGALEAARPLGIAMLLTATVVMLVASALLSSLPFGLNAPDATTTALLAVFAAGLADRTGLADPAETLATLYVGLALSSVVIGAVLAGFGLFRAGQAVRYVPYPVMAGFFAAGGLFLVEGGIRVGTGIDVEALRPELFLEPQAARELGATLLIGLAMLAIVPRFKSAAALPVAMLVGGIAIDGGLALAGFDQTASVAAHWLSRVPNGLPAFSPPWHADVLRMVHWSALAGGWSDLLSTALIVALSLMLSASALETATGRDADINRELRATGLAGMASGVAGGVIGTLGFVRCQLLIHAGSTTRLGGVVAGLTVAAVALFAPRLLELVPNAVVGGTLIFVGLQNLGSWVLTPIRRLPATEWAMLLVIAVTTFRFGTVPGIGVGVLAACIAFAARAAALPVITHSYRGNEGDSLVERSEAARETLRERLSAVLVLHLQGALFFGTVNRLLEAVRRELAGAPARFLIVDLSAVTELDSTGAVTVERLLELLARQGVQVLLAGVPPGVDARIPRQLALMRMRTVSEALAWCEECLLADAAHSPDDAPFRERLLDELGGGTAAEHLLLAMTPIAAPPGAIIIHQGDRADDLFFVESGRLAVEITFPGGRTLRIRTIGPGAMIGEVGFYTGLERTAFVRVDVDGAKLLKLTRRALEDLQRREPDAALRVHALIASRLSHRVIDMNRLTAALARSGPIV